jgi:steroid delta-isomerase-like uncharacterized protein
MHIGIKKMMLDENAAWNSHDVDKITTYYTEDCIKEDVAVGASTRGKRELKALLHRVFVAFPDLNVKLTSCFHSDEWAASEWIMHGTYTHQFPGMPPPTGRSFSVRGSTIMKLQNGEISRVSDYWNFMSFLQQLGLLPEDRK